ncbi:MAG: hypothetical protein ABIH03_05470 [Pseudomonadota bacterium]
MLRPWQVVTGEYAYHEAVLDDGSGPDYTVRDYVNVWAETKADAKVVAVKIMRASPVDYPFIRDCDCPFHGMDVQQGWCPHGVPVWEWEDCLPCQDLFEARMAREMGENVDA